jgi:hypothetical protein
MITHTTIQALGQARLADMHDQARRDALVRMASWPRRPPIWARCGPGSGFTRPHPRQR